MFASVVDWTCLINNAETQRFVILALVYTIFVSIAFATAVSDTYNMYIRRGIRNNKYPTHLGGHSFIVVLVSFHVAT